MSKTASRESFAALALGAMGVVYGDIGTSPLYTMKEVFSPATGIPLDATHLIGAVSVIFWGLMLVVTLKYVLLILRARASAESAQQAAADGRPAQEQRPSGEPEEESAL